VDAVTHQPETEQAGDAPSSRRDLPAEPRQRRGREQIEDFVRRRWTAAAAIVALAILSWPFAGFPTGVEGDWNWIAAMAYFARYGGFHYGTDVLWTFGPAGFLDQRPAAFFGDVAAMQLAYQWLVQLLLAGTLYVALKRSFGAVAAFLIALLAIPLLPERTIVLAFAWCALALLRRDDAPRDWIARLFPFAIGAVCGLLVLAKLNHAVSACAMALIALAFRPGRRKLDLLSFGGTLIAVAGAGWFATGQSLADVWPYLRTGRQVIGGYADAMGLTGLPAVEWTEWGAAVVVVLGTVLLSDVVRRSNGPRRIGLVLLWVVYLAIAFRSGFTRFDNGHTPMFFAAILVAVLLLPPAPRQKRFALAVIATCSVALVASFGGFAPRRQLDPVTHVRAAVDQAKALADRDQRAQLRAATEQLARDTFTLPQPVLDAVGDHTVAFWPQSLATVAYAYQLNWQPLPVLEPYAAYTPALDEAGADAVAAGDAPERIVRWLGGTIDNRHPTFEAPQTTVEIFCRYRQVAAGEPWQALARTQDRCGDERELATVDAGWGEPVEVPRPRAADAAVIVRIDGLDPAGTERLRALLLRSKNRYVQLDDASYRLVFRTATDGLLLTASSTVDYPAPFRLAPDPKTISVRRQGTQPGGTIRYRFSELPVAPFGGGR
jgi:hypothetical protein